MLAAHSTGDSLVIQFNRKGTMDVLNNPAGVLTNIPFLREQYKVSRGFVGSAAQGLGFECVVLCVVLRAVSTARRCAELPSGARRTHCELAEHEVGAVRLRSPTCDD